MSSLIFDTKKTQAFLAVIESGSFESAAKKLNLTASAISHRVKSLETLLGMPLVIREKPCITTEEGKKVYQHLRKQLLLDEEFNSQFFLGKQTNPRMRVAVNNDSLNTWFLPSVVDFIESKKIILDIVADDQDFTLEKVMSGHTVAAISSESMPIKGCKAIFLGYMRYRLLCSKAFFERWFEKGVHRNSLTKAPLLVFNEKDQLQLSFIDDNFSVSQQACNYHSLPSTESFFIAIKQGIGYGMISDLQRENELECKLIDIAPGRTLDVRLYWHYWDIPSSLLQSLTSELVENAKRHLKY